MKKQYLQSTMLAFSLLAISSLQAKPEAKPAAKLASCCRSAKACTSVAHQTVEAMDKCKKNHCASCCNELCEIADDLEEAATDLKKATAGKGKKSADKKKQPKKEHKKEHKKDESNNVAEDCCELAASCKTVAEKCENQFEQCEKSNCEKCAPEMYHAAAKVLKGAQELERSCKKNKDRKSKSGKSSGKKD